MLILIQCLVFFLRMIIRWRVFLCWATRSPSPPSLKTSTRNMSSNCISSPTSTISDRRASTLLRGTVWSSGCTITSRVESWYSEGWTKNLFSGRRWMEVIRSATVSSSSARVRNDKESHPLWVGSSCLNTHWSPSGGISPPTSPLRLFVFLFYT